MVVRVNGEDHTFDKVVMATHSDTARKLRGGDATGDEAAILEAIPYNDNKVFLHSGVPPQSLWRTL